MNTYIFIHGGESFHSHEEYKKWITSTLVEWNSEAYSIREEKKKWKTELARKLIEEGNIVYFPSFPNSQNAKYEEWKIFFESWIKSIKVQGDIVFIGTSLGGNFLLTYFGEKGVFPYTIKSIHFIAACQKCGDFNPPSSYEFLQKIENQAHIWHAEDDSVVPLSVGQEIAKNLPNAETHFFSSEKGYGHFHAVELFPVIEDTLLR